MEHVQQLPSSPNSLGQVNDQTATHKRAPSDEDSSGSLALLLMKRGQPEEDENKANKKQKTYEEVPPNALIADPQQNFDSRVPIESILNPSSDDGKVLDEKRKKIEAQLVQTTNLIKSLDSLQKDVIPNAPTNEMTNNLNTLASSTQDVLTNINPNNTPPVNPNPISTSTFNNAVPNVISPILNSSTTIYATDGTRVAFDVAWHQLNRANLAKQTLFYVENDKPQKGVPPATDKVTLLRTTKQIFATPPLLLQMIRADGNRYMVEEPIKLTLVSAETKQPLAGNASNCSCNGNPKISFRQERKEEFLLTTNSIGEIEFCKFHLGCLTGRRGHGGNISLKAEFTGEHSIFKGRSVYSPPIEVGAKGPFTKPSVKKEKSLTGSSEN